MSRRSRFGPVVYPRYAFDGVTRTPAFMRDPRRGCAPEKGVDPDLFFERGKAEEAAAVCRHCPFTNQCFAWAVATHEEHGVWGGKTRRISKAQRDEMKWVV